MIYVVENDVNVREIIVFTLKNCGFSVTEAVNAKDFRELCRQKVPEMVILDVVLPDASGIDIVRKMRNSSEGKQIPVILLAEKATEMDKVRGLDSGADDYITKPFGLLEFVARVKAVLRRAGNWQEEQEVFSVENICLNEAKHMVYVENKRIELTYKEYELLRIFMKNAGNVMTRELLLERIWGIDYEGESRTLDMHIKTLRKKLGTAGEQIKTIRNVGYRLEKE